MGPTSGARVNFLQFVVLGFGAGAAYALLAQGVVLVYRGSGVVNFAHGAIAMFGAYLFYEFRDRHHWAGFYAGLAAVGLMALGGVLFSQLIMKPLASRSGLTRLVATLALVTGLQSLAVVIWGTTPRLVNSPLPDQPITIVGITVPQDRLWLTLIAAVTTVALWSISRFSRIGLATSAMAENQLSAASYGWSPDALSALNWGVGAAFAAVAGILIAPLAGLDSTTLTLIVIEALAVALVASFKSFPLTLVFGLALGIVESLATRYVHVQGLGQAAALGVVVVILVVRGRSLPLRSHILERMPAIGTGKVRPERLVFWVAVALVCDLFLFPDSWVNGLITSASMSIILLSVVVLTGLTGQLSLAQLSIAGVGTLTAAKLVADYHWPFLAVIVVGAAASMVVGVVFALPALRTRGVNLAVVTLALALALQAMLFTNSSYTGGGTGETVGPQKVFGISLDPIFTPQRYGVLCIVLLVGCALMVTNLRRSRAGRRLIAVRANERAAAALGISVTEAKIYGFVVSSALAGIGGILLGFTSYQVVFEQYDPVQSIYVIIYALLGGVGYVLGAPIGGLLVTSGLVTAVGHNIPVLSYLANHPVLFAGIGLLAILLQNPDGMANQFAVRRPDAFGRLVLWLLRPLFVGLERTRSLALVGLERLGAHTVARRLTRSASNSNASADSADEPAPRRVRPATLSARDVTVRYGAVTAVRDVTLTVGPGEVVGLIGPNGAGKTSLLDALAGATRLSKGAVALDGQRIDRWPVHRRARAGIARSFQSLELFEDLTVRENLLSASDSRDRFAYLSNILRPGSHRLSTAALTAVRYFGLANDLDERPDTMSNGRRHLVSIARAAANAPSILLLDEPVSGLDEYESGELATLIRDLALEWGVGILVVEHDMGFVMRACDRIVVLNFGATIAEGTPAEVRGDPRVIAAYLGEDTETGSVPAHRSAVRA
jgi:ABC-type branched-subunit amino acid transport system ATPase component/branched-subunit amino acid ABC-type transport system permease component